MKRVIKKISNWHQEKTKHEARKSLVTLTKKERKDTNGQTDHGQRNVTIDPEAIGENRAVNDALWPISINVYSKDE